MKKMMMLIARVLMLGTVLAASFATQAAFIVGINTRDMGPTVKNEMFGANIVYSFNTLDQLNNTLKYLPQRVVRYPGGGVTEGRFNPKNPFKYLDGRTVPNSRNIRTYINLVNRHNWVANFVVPSVRYKNNVGTGKTEIKKYVRELLKGTYGRIEDGRTIHIEVGNEFYVDISAAQYGNIARQIVDGIDRAIKEANVSSRKYRIQVSVQAGRNISEAATIARYMKGRSNKVDFLVMHRYPWSPLRPLGLGNQPRFGDLLNQISAQWKRYAGYTKPYHLSEFNLAQHSDPNRGTKDYGLRNPLGIMALFAEAIRGNTQMATIWPLVASNNNLQTKLFESTNSRDVKPRTNAKFLRWMYDTVRGSRIIKNIRNNTYSSDANFRKGIHVEAFRKGSDTLYVYVFGTESAAEYVRLEFGNFRAYSVQAEKLYTARGKESDPTVLASSRSISPKLWSNNTKATFSINSNSQYEVVKLTFKGRFY